MSVIAGRTLVPGTAEGEVVVLDEPLSFWGGVDTTTGTVIDPHHPQHGVRVAGCVVLMPAGRGSSSSASVLAEAIRLRTAPAALVLLETDVALALGAIVAAELYGLSMPIVTIPSLEWRSVAPGGSMVVDAAVDGARLDTARR